MNMKTTNKKKKGNKMNNLNEQIETIKKGVKYRKAHLNLIKFALNKNYKISVFVEGETELSNSNKFKEIKDCVECADETVISIKDEQGNRKGNALIIPFNDDTDTVSDYHCTNFFNDWQNQYDKIAESLDY